MASPKNGFRNHGLREMSASFQSVRKHVQLSERQFDIQTLPVDMRRVCEHLQKEYGEEYGLTFVFMMRTAVELHRAWHMTLLTSKILQQLKDQFGMRMTWNLGVIRLKFRVEDGGFELHRKVPYDYDSEFQDLYMKIAYALMEGHINIHEALIFQTETKHGLHTAKSGLFLRDFPGRLLLYPLEAATCTVIFFKGDWRDAGVAALCGFCAGSTEYFLSWMGGEAKILIDIMAGIVTGIVGGLFYRLDGENYCLTAIFLGTLYWFFYGTAFVIGILEIIAGELETGVTRFIAVSVKTFVLSLGAGLGLLLTASGREEWISQVDSCDRIQLGEKWWRIPLYLLCSASALGQYRLPIVSYWKSLAVQLVGYEVQYQSFLFLEQYHPKDNMDTAASNILGAGAAVVVACALSHFVDQFGYYYNAYLLQRPLTKFGHYMYQLQAFSVRLQNLVGLGRLSDVAFLEMEKKLRSQTRELRDKSHPRNRINLDAPEEALYVEAIVSGQNLNIWAILMPAVYQLVPGSLIAKLWFNSIYPPPLLESEMPIEGSNFSYSTFSVDVENENVFANLMVISTSLAVGLILGFAVVQTFQMFAAMIFKAPVPRDETEEEKLSREREEKKFTGMVGLATDQADDPDSIHGNSGSEQLGVLVADSNRFLQSINEAREEDEEGEEQFPQTLAVQDGDVGKDEEDLSNDTAESAEKEATNGDVVVDDSLVAESVAL